MAAVAIATAGCSGEYKGLPSAEMLAYQTHSTHGSLHTLATAYAEAINASAKADTLHPGLYADYGVALALMGRKGPACRMLNSEMKAFPESRPMVTRLKQLLMPDMVADTFCGPRDTANLDLLASWAYDSLTARTPLASVAAVIDSTDTAWLKRQTPVDSVEQVIRLTANQKREQLAQEQAAALMAKQAYADSVAAAKQAKTVARQQAKADKEKAKKEKEKARKKADKQKKLDQKAAQKEKEQAAQERKKQKEKEAADRQKQREQQAEERRKQKEAEAVERQKQKEEEAAERKRQREEEAAERKRQHEEEAAERKREKEAMEAQEKTDEAPAGEATKGGDE